MKIYETEIKSRLAAIPEAFRMDERMGNQDLERTRDALIRALAIMPYVSVKTPALFRELGKTEALQSQ